MTNERAIEILKNEIHHCREHLGWKDMAPEYYQELGELVEAMELAVEKMNPQWNVITSRPMNAEERKEWSDKLGYALENYEGRIYGKLPEDGEEVIVCGFNGRVYLDTFYDEPDGCIFDYSDIEDVVAWMPKPEPYKEGKYE